jgi:hypothetical protein
LSHTSKYFSLPAGIYGLKTIFLLLAFMSLSRIKSIEALRYYAPGLRSSRRRACRPQPQ